MLRVIAPFNRDPAIAARHAFDRDTGKPVSCKRLKTYARALRHYHDHPEAKFLNGERGDRGPTTRRHIIVRSIRHIGKEANRLDSQLATGTDPNAQVEFGAGTNGRSERFIRIRDAVRGLGAGAVSNASSVSRQYLHQIMCGTVRLSENAFAQIEQGIAAAKTVADGYAAETQQALEWLRSNDRQISLRVLAKELRVSAGYLSRVISGARQPSQTLAVTVNRFSKLNAVREPRPTGPM